MKKMTRFTLNISHRGFRLGAIALCAGLLCGNSLLAGDSKDGKSPIEPAPEEPAFNNWIDLSLGGLIVQGNKAQFQQEHNLSGPVFGGIDDMHLEKTFANKAQLTLDARAIFDNSDYKAKLNLSMPGVGYVDVGYREFRTWFDPNGGYFPGNGAFIPPAANDFALDRGDAWIELGLRESNLPEITFRYDHFFRKGQEDSTDWASSLNTGIPIPTPAGNNAVRKIVPSFQNIDEKRDVFTLDAKKTFGNTDVNLGMRYEHTDNDDSLNEENQPGTLAVAAAKNPSNLALSGSNYYVTQENKLKMDLFSGHFSTETRFNDHLWLTVGYSYTSMDSNIGGSRINGSGFNSPYVTPFGPGVFVINNQLVFATSSQFLNLGGGADVGQNVGTVSLMWMPVESLTITPSLRVESNDTNSNSFFNTTGGAIKVVNIGTKKVPINVLQYSTVPGLNPVTTSINSTDDITNVAECLDIRYTGLENWVFYAQGDWEEEDEGRTDASSTYSSGSTILNLNSDVTRLRQKYTVGANWYPLRGLNLAVQYYHQTEDFDQSFTSDDPVMGNQRLPNQTWSTNDANARITWQPFANLSFVSRYDFQNTTIDSQWNSTITPGAFMAPYGTSGNTSNHQLSECVTWNPMDRLYIQGSVSYVLNRVSSPAAGDSFSVVNFDSNYWTATMGAGFAIDDKTELKADYSFYRANDYVNNSFDGLPYGSGATENTISASISRQISRNVRVMLKYSFDTYKDQVSGGYDNYTAQTIYSGLQIRF
jgi:hypothetical protein